MYENTSYSNAFIGIRKSNSSWHFVDLLSRSSKVGEKSAQSNLDFYSVSLCCFSVLPSPIYWFILRLTYLVVLNRSRDSVLPPFSTVMKIIHFTLIGIFLSQVWLEESLFLASFSLTNCCPLREHDKSYWFVPLSRG